MNKKAYLLPIISLCVLPFSFKGLTTPVLAVEGDALTSANANVAGLHLHQIESPACFHTVLQEKYIQDGVRSIDKYARANAELSRPDALKFVWDAKNVNKNAKPTYSFTISENSDLSNGRLYQTTNNYVNVYNLKLATRYYYQVTTNYGGSVSESEILYFSTENSMFRNLYIDGVINARDLGGWRNSEGKFMVRQGVLFRSGPFNVSNVKTLQTSITSSGLKETSYLGIKTEIDLRRTDNGETGGITSRSPLGSRVKYVSAPLNWDLPDNALKNEGNIASIKKVFATLGDSNNYPAIFHCTAGADRTGLIAFLINGLMGVSEDDLYRDYQFTDFANVSWMRYKSTILNSYIKTIKEQKGATLCEKIVNLLTSFGVPSSDISTVYNMLKGEAYRI